MLLFTSVANLEDGCSSFIYFFQFLSQICVFDLKQNAVLTLMSHKHQSSMLFEIERSGHGSSILI